MAENVVLWEGPLSRVKELVAAEAALRGGCVHSKTMPDCESCKRRVAEARVVELEDALRFLLGTIELGGATPEAKAEARAVLRLAPKGKNLD